MTEVTKRSPCVEPNYRKILESFVDEKISTIRNHVYRMPHSSNARGKLEYRLAIIIKADTKTETNPSFCHLNWKIYVAILLSCVWEFQICGIVFAEPHGKEEKIYIYRVWEENEDPVAFIPRAVCKSSFVARVTPRVYIELVTIFCFWILDSSKFLRTLYRFRIIASNSFYKLSRW